MANFKSIIIADDDEDDLLLFKEALEEISPDCHLSMISTGTELLNMLATMPSPDAIFLDYYLPTMNGKECPDIIRKQQWLDRTAIVILSGTISSVDIDYCLKNGATYYFEKPNNFEKLKQIISTVCNGNQL